MLTTGAKGSGETPTASASAAAVAVAGTATRSACASACGTATFMRPPYGNSANATVACTETLDPSPVGVMGTSSPFHTVAVAEPSANTAPVSSTTP